MSSHASSVSLAETHSRTRGAYVVSMLGPVTVAAGDAKGVSPYISTGADRVDRLGQHPRGEVIAPRRDGDRHIGDVHRAYMHRFLKQSGQIYMK